MRRFTMAFEASKAPNGWQRLLDKELVNVVTPGVLCGREALATGERLAPGCLDLTELQAKVVILYARAVHGVACSCDSDTEDHDASPLHAIDANNGLPPSS